MSQVKPSTFVAIGGAIVVFGYMFFSYMSDVQLDEFDKLYLNQDFVEAADFLEHNKEKIPSAKYGLYQSYLSRVKGDVVDSVVRLEGLDDALVNHGETYPFVEIRLNQMLNAYLLGQIDQLENMLQQTDLSGYEEKGWSELFQGIVDYQQKDYAEALEHFDSAGDRYYYSPLMKESFGGIFDYNWMMKHKIHSQIEVGNLVEARQNLEQQLAEVSEEEREDLIFLMGLSYAKEALEKNFSSSTSYYKLAFGYFDQVDLKKDKYQNDYNEISADIEAKTLDLIASGNFENLPFYVDLLEKVQDNETLPKLKSTIGQLLKEHHSVDLALVLNKMITKENERNVWNKNYYNSFKQSLNDGALESVRLYWNLARIFHNDPEVFDQDVADQIIIKFQETLDHDDSSLSRSTPYLVFWLKIQNDDKKKDLILQVILNKSEQMWADNQKKKQALHLMKLAQAIALETNREQVNKMLGEQLKKIYQQAVARSDMMKLNDIIDAVAELNLSDLKIVEKEDVTREFTKAKALLNDGDYVEAKKKAKWVLKFAPDNINAREVLGLSQYYLGHYEEAVKNLETVEKKTDQITEALAVAAILSGNSEKGEELLKGLQQVDEGLNLRVAYGWLMRGRPLKAMEWFETVAPTHPEVLSGRVFVAYLLHSWGEVIELSQQLPKPYRDLDGFVGLSIESMIALGQEEKAEERLRQLLSAPPQPSLKEFSPYFKVFINKRLNQWNRYFVAATFFREVKNEREKSLQYLSQIDNPSPISELEKAELYLELGRPNDALNVLTKLYQEVQESEEKALVMFRLLPLLASVYNQLGYHVDVIPYYAEFLSLYPDNLSYRSDYAEVLGRVRRYDLALAEYQKLHEVGALTPEDQIAYIEALVRQNKFDEANKQAELWLNEEEVSLLSLLKLGRLMILTQNKPLVDDIFKEAGSRDKMSLDEKLALIKLYIDIAEYEEALGLLTIEKKNLDDNPEVLMLEALLNSRLSKHQDAFILAQKAARLDPTRRDIYDFLKRYERPITSISQSISLTKEKIKDDPNNLTLQLDQSFDLVDLGTEKVRQGEIESLKESFELQEARANLERFVEKNNNLPQAYFLLGKIYYLLGRNDSAQKTFIKALTLDPSYVEVYQLMALIFEDQKKYPEAVKALYIAAKFAPTQAEIWEQLARVYLELDDVNGAINALMMAIRFSPNESSPHVQLAELYLQIKNPENAIASLERALALAPQNIDAIKLMILTLYDPVYQSDVADQKGLLKLKMKFFDKLQALNPGDAKDMRSRLGLEVDGF